ncbi:caspase family protein [Streptomyces sp. M10(2022)]
MGLPDTACTVIPQPRSVGEVLDTVRDRARRAEDTLLVYYAGHGLTDPHTDELYLAMPESDREREYTSLRYEYLRRAVLDQQACAQRTVVILDCCYSGRALLGKMSASTHIADQAVVEGICLITASAETRPALSPPGERYTAFTGELITTLTEGVPGHPDPLDMDTLYRQVHRTLAGKSRPAAAAQPQSRRLHRHRPQPRGGARAGPAGPAVPAERRRGAARVDRAARGTAAPGKRAVAPAGATPRPRDSGNRAAPGERRDGHVRPGFRAVLVRGAGTASAVRRGRLSTAGGRTGTRHLVLGH